MKNNKFLCSVLACTVVASTGVVIPASASFTETKVDPIYVAPYDNAAVIAKNGVSAHQSMRIEGDIYAGKTVEFDNAGENYLNGNIYSPENPVYAEWGVMDKEDHRQGTDYVGSIDESLDTYFENSSLYLVNNQSMPQSGYDENAEYTEVGSANIYYKGNGYEFNDYSEPGTSAEKDENGYPVLEVSENTDFVDGLSLNGTKLLIDASNDTVYVKTAFLSLKNGAFIEIKGDNPVYFISPAVADIRLNVTLSNGAYNFGEGNVNWIVTDKASYSNDYNVGSNETNSMICANVFTENAQNSKLSINCNFKGNVTTDANEVYFGDQANVTGDIYSAGTGSYTFNGKVEGDTVTSAKNVIIENSGQYDAQRITGNINAVNADSFKVMSTVTGNIITSATTLEVIQNNANVQGLIYAPNAAATVSATSDKGIVKGQLVCDSLDIFGEGAIVWGSADYTAPSAAPTEAATAAPTVAPTEKVTDEPEVDITTVETPDHTNPIELSNDYAYIFGRTDSEMEAEDGMHRGEACAVLYRLIKQNDKLGDFTYSKSNEAKFADINGRWDRSAIEFMAFKGAYQADASKKIAPDADITRGEAFKIFALALGMTNGTTFSTEQYAAILKDEGFISGDEKGNLNLNGIITRAEYCTVYNNITGRVNYGITTADGTAVTAEDYKFVDLNDSEWYYETMIKATSAYDDEGNVDFAKRGIRNQLDDYADVN